jgi:hypothetical protein
MFSLRSTIVVPLGYSSWDEGRTTQLKADSNVCHLYVATNEVNGKQRRSKF